MLARPTRVRRLRLPAVVATLALLASACAGATPPRDGNTSADHPPVTAWDAVVAAADGQTVQWWLFGGDDRVNGYIDDHVVPAAADLGVTLERVPVNDTADAVQRVVAERRAAQQDGSVDLVWVNGENFAAGKRAGLWLPNWAQDLPSAAMVDPSTVATDFGVEVDGQESPWSRALFVFAHDRERMPDPPQTFDDLMDHARAHPGRLTYPAPPDFTGSAFVRQVVAAMGEDEAMRWLADLEPLLWREGRSHPGNEAELNRLFADGEVDLAMSYDPGFVQTGVAQGQFPESTRPFVLEHGTLHNVSYVTIPSNAANREGALAVANLLLDPELQALKADPEVLGVPTVLDPDRLSEADHDRIAATLTSPYLLAEYGRLIDELPVDQVEGIEQRWRDEVLR